MKFVGHCAGCCDPDVRGEQGIHCASERLRSPLIGYLHTNSLAACVHARVGPAGTGGHSPRATKPLQHTLHLPLNGAAVGLTLPPGEISAIVLRYEKDPVDVAHAHKLSGLTAMCECFQIARCTRERHVEQVRAW